MDSPDMTDAPFRLTALAHGGGCGCKLSPAALGEILAKMPKGGPYADLLVGTETGDDAAVYRLNDRQAIVATTDFFTPIVDDPADFGRIAATNALSDVFAMGGSPIFALAVVGMPVGKVPLETVQAILAGGASACAGLGIPVAGGHSIDSPEPIYGLVALGLVHPDRVLRNVGAKPGDKLVLTKGLGIGIYGAALKRGELAPALYRAMIGSTTQVNVLGRDLAGIAGVNALTDVTGFGLLLGPSLGDDAAGRPRLPHSFRGRSAVGGDRRSRGGGREDRGIGPELVQLRTRGHPGSRTSSLGARPALRPSDERRSTGRRPSRRPARGSGARCHARLRSDQRDRKFRRRIRWSRGRLIEARARGDRIDLLFSQRVQRNGGQSGAPSRDGLR